MEIIKLENQKNDSFFEAECFLHIGEAKEDKNYVAFDLRREDDPLYSCSYYDLEKENPGIFDDPSKTFIDLYMKSGLYITELVKRLYNSEGLKDAFTNPEERLKHILENQVYGFAPSEIIYNISTNIISGNLSQDISRKNFVLEDTIPAAKEGRIQELVDKYFG